MSFPFRRILVPVDFDDQSQAAVDVAVRMARQNDGLVLLLHVVPMIIPAAGMPVYVDIYRGQEDAAKEKLRLMAGKCLAGIKYELLTHMGEPAASIVRAARNNAADLIVMATHGRHGFSRMILGSFAEMVLRDAPCPVLCLKHGEPDQLLVARWMSTSPVAVTPMEKLVAVQARMQEGGFRCVPVLEEGHLVGIVTDRDVRIHAAQLNAIEVRHAMYADPPTVTPITPMHEAARLLSEKKLDALPVIEDRLLVGMLTTNDVLRAYLDEA
jgi:universal stress protein A